MAHTAGSAFSRRLAEQYDAATDADDGPTVSATLALLRPRLTASPRPSPSIPSKSPRPGGGAGVKMSDHVDTAGGSVSPRGTSMAETRGFANVHEMLDRPAPGVASVQLRPPTSPYVVTRYCTVNKAIVSEFEGDPGQHQHSGRCGIAVSFFA
jgi:hypothetical protein